MKAKKWTNTDTDGYKVLEATLFDHLAIPVWSGVAWRGEGLSAFQRCLHHQLWPWGPGPGFPPYLLETGRWVWNDLQNVFTYSSATSFTYSSALASICLSAGRKLSRLGLGCCGKGDATEQDGKWIWGPWPEIRSGVDSADGRWCLKSYIFDW